MLDAVLTAAKQNLKSFTKCLFSDECEVVLVKFAAVLCTSALYRSQVTGLEKVQALLDLLRQGQYELLVTRLSLCNTYTPVLFVSRTFGRAIQTSHVKEALQVLPSSPVFQVKPLLFFLKLRQQKKSPSIYAFRKHDNDT